MIRLSLCFLLFLLSASINASDHADPISLKKLISGITGLFVFPKDDKLILVLGVRRGLSFDGPYDLQPYLYTINMDLNAAVRFDDAEDLARYGGTLENPAAITANVSIQFSLEQHAQIKGQKITGLSHLEGIETWSGVRDDPFIFPKFFGTNVIAMVVSIPFDAFPKDQNDWLVWATSSKNGKQIDHVGRANRTMLPRFNLLNPLPPSQHVATLNQSHEHPSVLEDIERTDVQPLFALRPYDFVADVLIYTRRSLPGFPNGRRLTDDVAAKTCAQGDCLLWELSFADSTQWPRQTVNDKPFLDDFPYLAEPWPAKQTEPAASLTTATKLKLAMMFLAVIGLFLLPWVLYIRCLHQLKRTNT